MFCSKTINYKINIKNEIKFSYKNINTLSKMRYLEHLIYLLHFLQILEQLHIIKTEEEAYELFGAFNPSRALFSKLLLFSVFGCRHRAGLRTAQYPSICAALPMSVFQLWGRDILFYYQDRPIEIDADNEWVRLLKKYIVNSNMPSRVLICLSILALCCSVALVYLYGFGDLYRVRPTGSFKVGHKLIYASKA